MIRAHIRLVEALGREIPIVDLFAYPSVRALARHLDGPGGEEGFAAEEERARLQIAARRRHKDKLKAREPEVVS
jgi:hypothetical protein